MLTLEQTKAAILSLPANEFEKLKQWLLALDYEKWDEELERDIAEGKLETLAQEAIGEISWIKQLEDFCPATISLNSRIV